MTFDPNSNDAMFAQILAKLDEQRTILDDIKDGLKKAEHRITLLEHWREELRGKTAAYSVIISGIVGLATSLIVHYLTR